MINAGCVPNTIPMGIRTGERLPPIEPSRFMGVVSDLQPPGTQSTVAGRRSPNASFLLAATAAAESSSTLDGRERPA